MAYKHGVYNTEQATSLTVPVQGIAGLQVIFGTAPIHMAKDPAAAVNTPKLVYSYKEAVEAVGYSDDFENFTLCQSISACFQVFNVAPIILVNVLVALLAEGVDRNLEVRLFGVLELGSPSSQRAWIEICWPPCLQG